MPLDDPLSTDVADGDPNHAGLHSDERAAVNLLSGDIVTIDGRVTVLEGAPPYAPLHDHPYAPPHDHPYADEGHIHEGGGASSSGIEVIEEVVLDAGGPIVFDDISQTFRSLRLVASLQGANSHATTGATWTLNDDVTDSNYKFQRVTFAGSLSSATSLNRALNMAGSGAGAGRFTSLVMDFPFYALADRVKRVPIVFGQDDRYEQGVAHWFVNAPVTKIALDNTVSPGGFVVGSRAVLYGI